MQIMISFIEGKKYLPLKLNYSLRYIRDINEHEWLVEGQATASRWDLCPDFVYAAPIVVLLHNFSVLELKVKDW